MRKSREDKQTLEELNLAHCHSQAKCQFIQTSLNEVNSSCFQHIINILLTKLSRSVWENLDLGRSVVCTELTAFGLYLRHRSRFSHTDLLARLIRAK